MKKRKTIKEIPPIDKPLPAPPSNTTPKKEKVKDKPNRKVNDKKKSNANVSGATNGNSKTNSIELPDSEIVEPDEPTYCICNQVSFGNMIAVSLFQPHVYFILF